MFVARLLRLIFIGIPSTGLAVTWIVCETRQCEFFD